MLSQEKLLLSVPTARHS